MLDWLKRPNKITMLVPVVQVAAPVADIVFIHGLNGDATTSWGMQRDPSWKQWIGDTQSNVNVWSLEYRINSSNWSGGSMPLTDRAHNVLATINAGLGQPLPIIFICHSYGGLLAKQMLRSAEVLKDAEEFRRRAKAIVFFGTPHNGSAIPQYIRGLSPVLRSSAAVRELEANAPQLRDLSQWFSKFARENSTQFQVFFETLNTRGFRVVDESSSDPHVQGVVPVGIDADHLDLCKPEVADVRVKSVQKLIMEVVSAIPTQSTPSFLSRTLLAPNDALPYLKAEMQAKAAEDPTSADIRKALALMERMERNSVASGSSDFSHFELRRASIRPPYGSRMQIGWIVGWIFGIIFFAIYSSTGSLNAVLATIANWIR